MAEAQIAVTLNQAPLITALEILRRHTAACIAELRELDGAPIPIGDLDDDPSVDR